MSPLAALRNSRRAQIIAALNGRLTTADQVAAEIGVSIRTIYRDIATLRAEGAPIEGEAGIGYTIRRPFAELSERATG